MIRSDSDDSSCSTICTPVQDVHDAILDNDPLSFITRLAGRVKVTMYVAILSLGHSILYHYHKFSFESLWISYYMHSPLSKV